MGCEIKTCKHNIVAIILSRPWRLPAPVGVSLLIRLTWNTYNIMHIKFLLETFIYFAFCIHIFFTFIKVHFWSVLFSLILLTLVCFFLFRYIIRFVNGKPYNCYKNNAGWFLSYILYPRTICLKAIRFRY
jgi:hypothetical protein